MMFPDIWAYISGGLLIVAALGIALGPTIQRIIERIIERRKKHGGIRKRSSVGAHNP